MMKFLININVVFSLLVLFCHDTSLSQKVTSNIKLKVAESYERSGDYESALRIYEEVFKKDSLNISLFDALKRNYLQLKRYDDAIALFNKWLKIQPDDISLLAQLGSVYILASDEQKAFKVWERAINISPKSEITYLLVANAMVESRLFERAIEIYKRGRTECKNSNLFTSDIAYLYSIMLNYTEATREYLKLLSLNPSQLSYVQSRIAGYTARAEGLTATTLVVMEAIKNDSNNIALQQLLAWLYMEGKDFERAYDVYRLIDAKTNAGGRELFNFAERAFREKYYNVAVKAYNELINTYPKFNQMPQAKFGLARTLEELVSKTDTTSVFRTYNPFSPISADSFANALNAYQNIVMQYPNTEIAARAMLRIGIIKQEKLLDLEGAKLSYESVRRMQGRNVSIDWEVKLRLGDVYFILGDMKKAENEYRLLIAQNSAPPALRDIAAFHIAEIEYFNGNYQIAVNKLDSLARNTLSDVSNDALTMKLFLEEQMKENREVLKKFADADLLKRQLKFSEALAAFESIEKEYPSSLIIEAVLMNKGDILTVMNKFEEAILVYDSAIKSFPESINLDRLLMLTGEVYQFGLKDKDRAIERYQSLLEKFSSSVYSGEARKRIRNLRGDNI